MEILILCKNFLLLITSECAASQFDHRSEGRVGKRVKQEDRNEGVWGEGNRKEGRKETWKRIKGCECEYFQCV